MNKKGNGMIIIVLLILVLGLVGYIAYDKMILEKSNSNLQEDNNNNNDDTDNDLTVDVDFNNLFKKAEELYAVFTPHFYVKLDKTEVKTYNGKDYYLVNTEDFKFKSFNEMKSELSKIFCDSIVNKVLYGEALYKEFNGKLYRQDGFAQDMYTATSSTIEKNVINDDLVLLSNNISFSLDGPGNNIRNRKIYYVVSKNESGNWIFETFVLPISLMR